MKAVIPAAGLGTRFLPYTKSQPKEMLPVVDKPALQYVVEECVAAGIQDILIVTGRGKRAVEDYFDSNPELEAYLGTVGRQEDARELRKIAQGAQVYYVRQREPLGLGHALLCAKRFVGNEPFAVLLGDDLCVDEQPVVGQLVDLHRRTHHTVVGLQEVPAPLTSLYGIAETDSPVGGTARVRSFIEKPQNGATASRLACIGRYILPPRVFDVLEQTRLPNREQQLTPALDRLAKEDNVLGLIYRGSRFDLGRKSEWISANLTLGLKRPDLRDDLVDLVRRCFEEVSRDE